MLDENFRLKTDTAYVCTTNEYRKKFLSMYFYLTVLTMPHASSNNKLLVFEPEADYLFAYLWRPLYWNGCDPIALTIIHRNLWNVCLRICIYCLYLPLSACQDVGQEFLIRHSHCAVTHLVYLRENLTLEPWYR